MKEICLNFVVSAVVVANSECALPDYFCSRLGCDCNFKINNDGKGYTRVEQGSPFLLGPTHSSGMTYEEDHVVTVFQRDASFRCEENSITQASFHVYFKPDRDEGRMSMKVKKCGIRILYCKINDESSFLCSE